MTWIQLLTCLTGTACIPTWILIIFIWRVKTWTWEVKIKKGQILNKNQTHRLYFSVWIWPNNKWTLNCQRLVTFYDMLWYVQHLSTLDIKNSTERGLAAKFHRKNVINSLQTVFWNVKRNWARWFASIPTYIIIRESEWNVCY